MCFLDNIGLQCTVLLNISIVYRSYTGIHYILGLIFCQMNKSLKSVMSDLSVSITVQNGNNHELLFYSVLT